MPSISIILLSILLAVLVYHLFTKIRSRRTRPPLPPGPQIWPIIGNLPNMGPAPHHTMAALAQKYGPLIHLRFGLKDVVVAASASVAAQFSKTHDANFLSRPVNSATKHAYNLHDLVFEPYGPRWQFLRKITSVHLFSGKALEDFRQVSGRSLIVQTMVLAGKFNGGDFVPAIEWLDLQGVNAKMKKVTKRFDEILTKFIEEHKANVAKGKHTHDLLSTLLSLKEDADDEGWKLTENDIKALFLDIFLAGTDTSSSTVEWAISELIRNPKILAQVQEELDRVVGRDRLVSELDLPQLTYLKAEVKEAFRLHPSTPLSLPRMAAESCEINGYYIPKGTTLLVHLWAIGRDPTEWSDPLENRPERFLPGGEKAQVDVRGNDFEVIPFGSGRRICVGMSLGIRMVQLLTASLVHAFNFNLPNGLVPKKLNMDETYGLTLQRATPLVVLPCPRLAQHAYQA